jgi:hypothetical protein
VIVGRDGQRALVGAQYFEDARAAVAGNTISMLRHQARRQALARLADVQARLIAEEDAAKRQAR